MATTMGHAPFLCRVGPTLKCRRVGPEICGLLVGSTPIGANNATLVPPRGPDPDLCRVGPGVGEPRVSPTAAACRVLRAWAAGRRRLFPMVALMSSLGISQS